MGCAAVGAAGTAALRPSPGRPSFSCPERGLQTRSAVFGATGRTRPETCLRYDRIRGQTGPRVRSDLDAPSINSTWRGLACAASAGSSILRVLRGANQPSRGGKDGCGVRLEQENEKTKSLTSSPDVVCAYREGASGMPSRSQALLMPLSHPTHGVHLSGPRQDFCNVALTIATLETIDTIWRRTLRGYQSRNFENRLASPSPQVRLIIEQDCSVCS
jgi:hypothetical protein